MFECIHAAAFILFDLFACPCLSFGARKKYEKICFEIKKGAAPSPLPHGPAAAQLAQQPRPAHTRAPARARCPLPPPPLTGGPRRWDPPVIPNPGRNGIGNRRL